MKPSFKERVRHPRQNFKSSGLLYRWKQHTVFFASPFELWCLKRKMIHRLQNSACVQAVPHEQTSGLFSGAVYWNTWTNSECRPSYSPLPTTEPSPALATSQREEVGEAEDVVSLSRFLPSHKRALDKEKQHHSLPLMCWLSSWWSCGVSTPEVQRTADMTVTPVFINLERQVNSTASNSLSVNKSRVQKCWWQEQGP